MSILPSQIGLPDVTKLKPEGNNLPAHIPALDGIRGLAILLVMIHHFTVIPKPQWPVEEENATYSVKEDAGGIVVHTAGMRKNGETYEATYEAESVEDLRIRHLVGYEIYQRHHTYNKADAAVWNIADRTWCGVDVFFVLSGFLITGILFDSKQEERYFLNFYARRTVRIFPLYYAVIFITLVLLPHFPSNYIHKFSELHGVHEEPVSQAWYWLYLSNIHMGFLGKYTSKVLSPTWSLAIEEQFYLIWPTVILFLTRRTLLSVCVAIMSLSVLLRLVIMGVPHNMLRDLSMSLPEDRGHLIYMFTFTRMDSLALGAFIALVLRKRHFTLERGAGRLRLVGRMMFGVAMLALAVMWFGEWRRWNWKYDEVWLYFAIAVASGGLLLLGLGSEVKTLAGRIFNASWLRFLGRYSYAIYLFHLPIAVIISDRLFGPHRPSDIDKPASELPRFFFPMVEGSQLPGQLIFYVIVSGVSIGAALASWHLYEKHFLKLKKYFPTHSAKTVAAADVVPAGPDTSFLHPKQGKKTSRAASKGYRFGR